MLPGNVKVSNCREKPTPGPGLNGEILRSCCSALLMGTSRK